MASSDRYAAFLRGINVGRAKRIAMSDLRALVTDLGFGDVRTLLNSGNVVFTSRRSPPTAVAERIERALATECGLESRVTVLTSEQLASVAMENPFRDDDIEPSRLLIGLLRDPDATRPRLAPLQRADWSPDAFAVGTRAAYLACRGGILESRIPDALARAAGPDVTTRNWSTVQKVLALLEQA